MTSRAARKAAAAATSAARRTAQKDPTARGADWRSTTVATVNTNGTIVTADGIPVRRMREYRNPAVGDQIIITQNGARNWLALGRPAPAVDDQWTSYTPTVGGGGSATFGIHEGWYTKLGSLVYFEAYIALSAAGSGTSAITVTLPSTPYRGAARYRQVVPCYGGGVAAGSNSSVSGSFSGLVLAGGTGAMLDQVRGPTDIQLRGDNLQASTILTVNGWYREA